MAVDTSVIGKHTGAWRVVLDQSVLANFAKSVGDKSAVYQQDTAARAAGLKAVPAPPTFTFAAPYWAAFRADEQPADPTEGLGNPMHSIMGDLYAKGQFGGIFALRDTNGDGRADTIKEFGPGDGGTHIAFHDGWLYHSSRTAVSTCRATWRSRSIASAS